MDGKAQIERNNPARLWSAGWLVIIAIAMLSAGVQASCTEASLKKVAPETQGKLDNQLRIKGTYCTEESGQVAFPVKVLFILDESGSLQCTDEALLRFEALDRAVQQIRSKPNTEVGFIGFAARIRQQDFTRNRDDLDEFVDAASGVSPATDYQGALATAIRVIEEDMLESGPAERARTRYKIVFVSDGVPDPRCNAGCEDDQNTCSNGEDDDGDGLVDEQDPDCDNIDDNSLHPDNLDPVCNTTQELDEDLLVDRQGICPAYNQPEQIFRRVDELLSLKETYSAGALDLSTILLFASQEQVEARCPGAAEAFGIERTQAEALLRDMADAGNGTFRDVNTTTSGDSFLQVDITEIKSERVLSQMLARNEHTVRDGAKLLNDSDSDGLDDVFEVERGLDRYSADSDGDGFSDYFEWTLSNEGFDPLDDTLPAIGCGDTSDRDGDGLNACEETFLETDDNLSDSDDDDMIDGHEFRAGTNPLKADALDDIDFDGATNRDELKGGTDPTQADIEVYRAERVVYGLEDKGLQDVPEPNSDETKERHCYDYDVQNISLGVTPLPEDRGLNRILLYSMERPARVGGFNSVARVACFEAFYDGSRDKSPASGVIDVTQEALDQRREELVRQFDGLRLCDYFDKDPPDVTRDDVLAMGRQCIGRTVRTEGKLYDYGQLRDVVESYVRNDFASKLPEQSFQQFRSVRNFDPDDDCFRPWEYELLSAFVDKLEDACDECTPPEN